MSDEPAGLVPRPDPTLLTTEQLLREIANTTTLLDSRLDVIRTRLDGMDEAARLVRDDVVSQVGHLKEVTTERFTAVESRFHERDVRMSGEARANKEALDAALTAQKEAALRLEESNAKAVEKSEKATADAIGKLQDLFNTTIGALNGKVDDVRDSVSDLRSLVNGLIANKQGGTDTKTDFRLTLASVVGVLLLVSTVVGFVFAYSAKP